MINHGSDSTQLPVYTPPVLIQLKNMPVEMPANATGASEVLFAILSVE